MNEDRKKKKNLKKRQKLLENSQLFFLKPRCLEFSCIHRKKKNDENCNTNNQNFILRNSHKRTLTKYK